MGNVRRTLSVARAVEIATALIAAVATLGLLGCSSGTATSTGTGGSPTTGASGGATSTSTGGTTTGTSSGGSGMAGATSPGTGGANASGGSGGRGGTGGMATGGAASGGTAAGGNSGGGGLAGGAAIVELFNGTDLSGFAVYKATTFANNAPGVLVTGAAATAIFKPENGMIHVYADTPDKSLQYHYLLQTLASYSKYNLSWDYKWGTKKFQIDSTGRGTDLTMFPRDAGVLWQIHGDRTQIWPSSIEFQNKWGSTGDIFALYAQCVSLGLPSNMTQFAEATAGGVPVTVIGGLTQHLRSANFETPGVGPNAATGEGSDWNTCLLQASNGVAVYTVNGQIVNRTSAVMDSTGKPVTSGYIAWQAEQAEVYYRNLRIQVLP